MGDQYRIEPAPTSEMVFRATVRRVPRGELGGDHHVFVNTFDSLGQPLSRTILWTWDGRNAEEQAPPVKTDVSVRPMSNIPIWMGQRIAVWVDGGQSDRVVNIHTMHDDEPQYGTRGHFSYEVTFRQVRGETVTPPTTPPDQPKTPTPAIDQDTLNKAISTLEQTIAMLRGGKG